MDAQSKQTLTWRSRMVAKDVGLHVVEDPEAHTFSMSREGRLTTPLLHTDDPDFAALVAGGTLHEALHYAESDFAVLDACTAIERNFMMPLEDLRTETIGCRRFAGGKAELVGMWEALYRRNQVSRPDPASDDTLYNIGAYVLAFCRHEALGLAEAAIDAPWAREILMETLDPEAVGEIDTVLALSRVMTSTADALELARRILLPYVNPEDIELTAPRIKGSSDTLANDPVPQQAGGRESKATGEAASKSPSVPNAETGRNGPSTAANEGNGDAGSEPGGNAGEGGAVAQAGDAQGEGQGAPQASAGGAGGQQANAEDSSSRVQQAIEHNSPRILAEDFPEVCGDGGDLVAEAVATIVAMARGNGKLGGAQEVTLTAVKAQSADSVAGAQLMNSAIANTVALRARLRHTLRAGTQQQSRFASRGTLVPTRLWKLRTGDSKVFVHWDEAVEYRTLLEVLVDRSTSMGGSPLALAMEAACATCYAVEGTAGIKSKVAAFPGENDAIVRLKDHRERTHMAAGRMAMIEAYGGTPLAEALRVCQKEMMKVPAERRILIVATDGLPKCKVQARAAVAALKRAGIEVLFIGIGYDASDLGADSIRISSVQELATVLVGRLQERFAEMVRAAA
jgi:Mg-chelatase subunit ChlD